MVIIGASGHAKVISNILYLSGVSVSAYYDDRQLEFFNSIKVFCPINTIPANNDAIIAIGNNSIRKRIESAHPTLNYTIAIHPKSVIDKSVSIGVGTVVMASATINNSTTIGKHCIINTSSSIDHDCKLENYVHISPGAVLCGGIQISEGSQIGVGAVVCPNIKIGKWVTVGAGTVVINDIPDYAVVVGNPAKIIKYNEK
jgi:sugar O-acyltransferase (sialic acid O-acetyltransferase NeuD family)